MRVNFCVLMLWLIFGCSSGAVYAQSNLPIEHEAARLMLALESSVGETDWLRSEQLLSSLDRLGVELPDSYYYFKGVTLAELQRFDQAQSSLELYVVNAGQKGEHYEAALRKITALQVAQERAQNDTEKQASIVLAESEGASDGYIKSLQALYLTNDPIEALVLQINSLLSSHAYTGSRLKKAGSRTGLLYQLSVSGQSLVLQEKSYLSGAPELKLNKLQVLGVDPFLRSACAETELKCWIYHPGNKHDYWITIDRDEMVLRELVEAISKLIRVIQA